MWYLASVETGNTITVKDGEQAAQVYCNKMNKAVGAFCYYVFFRPLDRPGDNE